MLIAWALCLGSVHALNTAPSTGAQRISAKVLSAELGPTLFHSQPRSLTSKLKDAWENNSHPDETQDELGNGVFLTEDWRRAWYTYAEDGVIDPETGYANYVIDEIDGKLPDDLVGTLYRNGGGKFGVNDQRVAHVLDADGLVLQITIPPPSPNREVRLQSRFVATEGFQEELKANRFVQRGTFGSGPMGDEPGSGVDADPTEATVWTKFTQRAFKTNIKNTANTQVVAFGGKLLTFFEAGLPYELNPETLETIGEDDMDGALPKGKLAVTVPNVPSNYLPEFIGGAAHTAHPKRCPRTGNLVGWHWSQVVTDGSLQMTVTEWASDGFTKIASRTVTLPNCELAPHDMVLTENYIFIMVNSLSMNTLSFLSGLKGPAESLSMDGRGFVTGFVFARPTSDKPQVAPIEVTIPPCFSIHFSHGYEDEKTGNLVAVFSGWPPSDASDFLGAWGGFCPTYDKIPETFLWRVEIDIDEAKTVDMSIAPGSINVCAEHCVVHPNFLTKQAQNVYTMVSNLIGDSTAPGGFARHRVEDGSMKALKPGERNEEIDCYFYGTRYFGGEPLVVPKVGSDFDNEDQAYLVGLVCDSVTDKTFVSIFDLERPLRDGPVCNMWLKSQVPHGLHGCFDPQSDLKDSFFC
jgi:all-trans-8'-apo-beta-carotenal 15,15'-oxygenase